MGVGSHERATEKRKRDENSRKPEPVRYPTVVAKNTDGQGMGEERTVSFEKDLVERGAIDNIDDVRFNSCHSDIFHCWLFVKRP